MHESWDVCTTFFCFPQELLDLLGSIAIMSSNNVESMKIAKPDGNATETSVTAAKETSASTVSSLDSDARAARSGTSKRAAIVCILNLCFIRQNPC